MTADPQVHRRTVAKGALWATPVVLASSVAPAYAASPESACDFTVAFDTTIVTSSTTGATMIATGTDGRTIDIQISAVAGTGTSLTVHNLNADGNGLQATLGGESSTDPATGCAVAPFYTFTPPGQRHVLVLNQVASVSQCDFSGLVTTPQQRLTFEFTDGATGLPVGPITNLTLTVFDISSVTNVHPDASGRYWDTVAFEPAPTSIGSFIDPSTNQPAPSTGDGSLASPFFRNDPNYATTPNRFITDTFFFDRINNGLTLQYGNRSWGYQFIAVSGLSFSAPCA